MSGADDLSQGPRYREPGRRSLASLTARGVGQARVTLHVGAGTFLPVKTERVEDHAMHGETGEITATIRSNTVVVSGARSMAACSSVHSVRRRSAS